MALSQQQKDIYVIQSHALARIFLTGAILTEVAGTSSMAMIPENEAGWLNYLPMWLLISFSYLLLAKAAKNNLHWYCLRALGGLGIALITVVSVLFLDYHLNAQELIGLALAIVGIVLVTMGETHDEPTTGTGSIRRLGAAHDKPAVDTGSPPPSWRSP
ncbi:multidrug transporter [Aeromonas hydrophila]|uniref:Multidrug transporter n=1 Tax=Aeromonas hydrophila TaxID=644 RepID=A0A926FPK1_AERHY|nr:multidrug transporter [Aeromonas hydrophila]